MTDKVKSSITNAVAFLCGDVIFWLRYAQRQSENAKEKELIACAIETLEAVADKLRKSKNQY